MTEVLNPQTVPTTDKVSLADRKALAKASFVVGTDVATAAATFSNVPNSREFLDATYNATVAQLMSDPANHADPAAVLTPLGELRSAIGTALDALVPQKQVRVIDPVSERLALVERLATLSAVHEHLNQAARWISDLAEAMNVDDITTDEQAVIDAGTVPEKVIAATEKIAAALTSTPRKSGTGEGRGTVNHSADAAKLTVGRVLVAKGDATKTATVVQPVDDKGFGKGAYQVGTDLFDAISSAASELAGGQRNGWTYFDLS